MIRSTLLVTTALAALPLAPALAQDAGNGVTIVLGEDIDLVEPCMATRSNIGRIILQNVSETLTEFDVTGEGLVPRLAESWEQYYARTRRGLPRRSRRPPLVARWLPSERVRAISRRRPGPREWA